jgi:hypothetical protein
VHDLRLDGGAALVLGENLLDGRIHALTTLNRTAAANDGTAAAGEAALRLEFIP